MSFFLRYHPQNVIAATYIYLFIFSMDVLLKQKGSHFLVYRKKITIIIYYELIKLNEPLSNKKQFGKSPCSFILYVE